MIWIKNYLKIRIHCFADKCWKTIAQQLKELPILLLSARKKWVNGKRSWQIDLDMAALEEEKKAFMQAYKDKLKPKKERKKTLLTDIKRGYEEITDECFKFMDRSTRTTGYYNGNGDLVKERPMEAQEMQKTVFEDIESTGTEG